MDSPTEISINGLKGYRKLARLLLGPPTNASNEYEGELKITVYESIPQAQAIEELTIAFRSNAWVKKLVLNVFEPDDLVPLLKLALLLSKIEELSLDMQFDGEFGATHVESIASFINSPSHSSLQHLEFLFAEFVGDFMPLWDAVQRSNTLQEVCADNCRFDAANCIAFANCFKNTGTEKKLILWGGTFEGTTIGSVVADICVQPTDLKSLKFHPMVDERDLDGLDEEILDPVAEFEPFMDALKRQVDPSASPSKLELTIQHDVFIRLLTEGLPDFTNLRDLSVYVYNRGPIAAMKELMVALKLNGSLYTVRLTYSKNSRRGLTYGKTFQDAIGQRNKRVPELLREARKQEESSNRLVQGEDSDMIVQEEVPKSIVPTLSVAGIQSPRMAYTTLLAAFTSWDGLGHAAAGAGSKRSAHSS